MAESQVSFGYVASPGVWEETSLTNVATQAKVGQSRVYNIDIDNAAIAVSYVKVYYAAIGDVIVGTTAPDEIIPVPASTRLNHAIIQADDVKMNVGMVLAAVTTPGTGGVTPPASAVAVRVTMDM